MRGEMPFLPPELPKVCNICGIKLRDPTILPQVMYHHVFGWPFEVRAGESAPLLAGNAILTVLSLVQ